MNRLRIKRVDHHTANNRDINPVEFDIPAITVEPSTKIRYGLNNEPTYTRVSAVLPPDADIKSDDLIVWAGLDLPLLELYRAPDANGIVTHIEVLA